MDKKKGCFGTVPDTDIPDFPAPRLIITDTGLDMPVFKPFGKIFIIHPELYEPVRNKKSNDQKD